MRIGINTGGGDAPGLNAVIHAVVLSAHHRGWEVYGIQTGYAGLLDLGKTARLTPAHVEAIVDRGGTILGTTNRADPFRFPVKGPGGEETFTDLSDEVVRNFRALRLDALVAVGGDGSMALAARFAAKGIPVVGVPKTIDNDLADTNYSFGFDTAVSTATDAVDKLHSTASAHQRVFVVEVMGRYVGWIALHTGLTGSADVILLPEVPFDLEHVCEKIRANERRGKAYGIIVAAEGARPVGGQLTIRAQSGRRTTGAAAGRHRRVGGARGGPAHREGDPRPGAGTPAARRLPHPVRSAGRAPLTAPRRCASSPRGSATCSWPTSRRWGWFPSPSRGPPHAARPCRWTATPSRPAVSSASRSGTPRRLPTEPRFPVPREARGSWRLPAFLALESSAGGFRHGAAAVAGRVHPRGVERRGRLWPNLGKDPAAVVGPEVPVLPAFLAEAHRDGLTPESVAVEVTRAFLDVYLRNALNQEEREARLVDLHALSTRSFEESQKVGVPALHRRPGRRPADGLGVERCREGPPDAGKALNRDVLCALVGKSPGELSRLGQLMLEAPRKR